MKKIFIALLAASTSLGFVSCSNDDDNTENGPVGNISENINQVFPSGSIKSIKREASWFDGSQDFISDITRDEAGRVISMKYEGDPYLISYTSANTVQVTTYEWYEDADGNESLAPYVRTFTLGANGFINGFYEKVDSEIYSIAFGYDTQGRIVSRTGTYSDETETGTTKMTFTYDGNGDLVKIDQISEYVYDGTE